MNNIRELIMNLSWKNSRTVQENAIRELRYINDQDIVLLAKQDNNLCSKECWENAAIVLRKLGHQRIYPVIPYLMQWFQDINWPGVLTIIELFKEMDVNILIPYVEDALKNAADEDDEMWVEGLNQLAQEIKCTNC